MEFHEVQTLSVAPKDVGLRLDRYVSTQLADVSRSYAASLTRSGHIRVDGVQAKPSHKIRPHEEITIRIPPPEPVDLIPEPIPLDIQFEDRHVLVINKPAGLVVHPSPGHRTGTLVNGILHHCPQLEGIGGEQRPGIVHRLDKDTSGLIVIAKTTGALQCLSQQFKDRSVRKNYLALVHGIPPQPSGSIDLPVGRHPVDRKKMSTISHRGREALTLWRIKEKYHCCALLEIDLKTGRTHQIRVHCKSMGHPLVGDPVYGFRKKRTNAVSGGPDLRIVLAKSQRQMLHAYRLLFLHPVTREEMVFEVPPPSDMADVVNALAAI